MKDVWITGHSRRCSGQILYQDFYVANMIIPTSIEGALPLFERWLPTCMACVIDFYGEYFSGDAVARYLKPVTPERRKEIKEGLLNLLRDPGIDT